MAARRSPATPIPAETRIAILEDRSLDIHEQMSAFIRGTEEHRKWVDAEQLRHRTEVKSDQDMLWTAMKQQSADFNTGMQRQSAELAEGIRNISAETAKSVERAEKANAAAIERTERANELGIAKLSEQIKDLSNKKPSFGEDNIKTLVGFLVIGVGALWAVIGLLVNPIGNSQAATADSLARVTEMVNSQLPLMSQRITDHHTYVETGLKAVDHESQARHDAQQTLIDTTLAEMKELRAWQLAMAEWKGETRKAIFMLFDDAGALKEDLQVHENTSHHPTSNVQILEGRLKALEYRLQGTVPPAP